MDWLDARCTAIGAAGGEGSDGKRVPREQKEGELNPCRGRRRDKGRGTLYFGTAKRSRDFVGGTDSEEAEPADWGAAIAASSERRYLGVLT